ncbi:MAG: hypothetical protein M3Y52_04160 [Actinomycetota bacterium]|nr:hypothetical protein [Actinomycetota bacterium]
MDWTFWVFGGLIAAAVVVTSYRFSHRRHSEQERGRRPDQADGITDFERQRERGRSWHDLSP